MKNSDRFWGSTHLILWALLILAGIVAKRVYNQADWMVFFHLPAAVFLVLGFYRLAAPFRRQRAQEILKFDINSRVIESGSQLQKRIKDLVTEQKIAR